MKGRFRGIGRERSQLRWALGSFFLALALPTAILVRQAALQVQWESFHQQRTQAAELTAYIDTRINQLIEDEDARSVADYSFLVVAGDPAANYVQRSALSNYHARPSLPGLLGYFQIDPQQVLTTPLLPAGRGDARAYGISGSDWRRRVALQYEVQRLLSGNRLAPDGREQQEPAVPAGSPHPHPEIAERQGPRDSGAAAGNLFDRLASLPHEVPPDFRVVPKVVLGRVEQLRLVSRFSSANPQERGRPHPGNRKQGAARKEKVVLLEPEQRRTSLGSRPLAPVPGALSVATFDAEVLGLKFTQLESGHFLLFRNAFRNRARYVQGLLLDSRTFLDAMIAAPFLRTPLCRHNRLLVAHRGNILGDYAAVNPAQPSVQGRRRELLYRARLSAPLDEVELIFTIDHLPSGAGTGLIAWTAGLLGLVLCGGFLLMYRLGARQIDVNHQQQEFVAAVSHELKTPLTSIRMYGEMLREGWVSDDKKRSCYDFICSESERLSRLIGNVLDLARMTRSRFELGLKPTRIGELTETLRVKVISQFGTSGFEFRWLSDDCASTTAIRIDEDAFTQIVINLVDNAVKFSAKSQQKLIEIGWQRVDTHHVAFRVRDFGPGIPRALRRKVFKLFYRGEYELTRDTAGTGIGLALVQRLAHAMKADVELLERTPGAEFRVLLPSEEPTLRSLR